MTKKFGFLEPKIQFLCKVASTERILHLNQYEKIIKLLLILINTKEKLYIYIYTVQRDCIFGQLLFIFGRQKIIFNLFSYFFFMSERIVL